MAHTPTHTTYAADAQEIYVPSGLFGKDGIIDGTDFFVAFWPVFADHIWHPLIAVGQVIINALEGPVRALPNDLMNFFL